MALLRKDADKGFRIDIEADSTILPDEMQEKADRTEFIGKFVPLMEQIVPVAQGNPPMANLAKEIVLFAVRGFKVARTLEDSIEKAFDALGGMPPVPPKGGKGKDPAEIQADLQAVNAQVEQGQQHAAMMKVATEAQVAAAQLEEKKAERAQSGQLEGAKLTLDAKKADDAKEMHNVRMLATESRLTKNLK